MIGNGALNADTRLTSSSLGIASSRGPGDMADQAFLCGYSLGGERVLQNPAQLGLPGWVHSDDHRLEPGEPVQGDAGRG